MTFKATLPNGDRLYEFQGRDVELSPADYAESVRRDAYDKMRAAERSREETLRQQKAIANRAALIKKVRRTFSSVDAENVVEAVWSHEHPWDHPNAKKFVLSMLEKGFSSEHFLRAALIRRMSAEGLAAVFGRLSLEPSASHSCFVDAVGASLLEYLEVQGIDGDTEAPAEWKRKYCKKPDPRLLGVFKKLQR